MSELKEHLFVPYSELQEGDELTDAITIAKSYYLKYEADKVITRHKYKRCLAMAEMCEARYEEEDAKVNGCGASWEYISKEMKYWERWHKRWLELAEKFKPNSTATKENSDG